MRRLFLAYCLISLLAACLAALSVTVGRAQPASDRVRWLHLTDCALPCWAGIAPGSTTGDVAEDRLALLMQDSRRDWSASDPKDVLSRFRTWTAFNPDSRIMTTFFLEVDDGSTALVGIGANNPDPQLPLLADMLLIYGPPTCILVGHDLTAFNLFYENGSAHVLAEIVVDRLDWRSPIHSFTVEAEGPLQTCGKLRSHPWRGLYPPAQYLLD